jgi:predicted ArsR family transcriptional regulator
MHRLGMSRDEVLRLLCDLEARGLVTHEALAPKGARSRVKGYRVASIFD